MITGNDNQKASVGFKAFGLRTEGSCTDFTGLLGFVESYGKRLCVRAGVCLCTLVCG